MLNSMTTIGENRPEKLQPILNFLQNFFMIFGTNRTTFGCQSQERQQDVKRSDELHLASAEGPSFCSYSDNNLVEVDEGNPISPIRTKQDSDEFFCYHR